MLNIKTDFFENYTSNSTAGTSNQFFFSNQNADSIYSACAFYGLSSSGNYRYSFLMSNILDSTYPYDGSAIHDMKLDCWTVYALEVAQCENDGLDGTIPADGDFMQITYHGRGSWIMNPGDVITTDPIWLHDDKKQYICIKISFCGKQVPYHKEAIIPIYNLKNGSWIKTDKMPLPGMIGCDRTVKKRISFLGDSITQGIGTTIGCYRDYASLIAKRFGTDYAYWNLGIGRATALDAAFGGIWYEKMKHSDIATVCFGVNDIIRGRSSEIITGSLDKLVSNLKKDGVTVIMQTIPPFDFEHQNFRVWKETNEYIRNKMFGKVDALLDTTEFLTGDIFGKAKFGKHPDDTGHAIWADKLSKILASYL